MKEKFKEFKPTSWAIDNKISIYVLVTIIAIFGIINYNTIPKEQFPEIVIPTIIVNTIYPGTSPADIENLITRPLEKNLKAINGVKKITSNSIQDFSSIAIEFNTGIDVADAKQKVKDAVDKTKSSQSLPNNLPSDPSIMEIDFSEIPIMNINLSGDIELSKLKKYGEILQDQIESLSEITRVDIIGALDREILVEVDMFKMQSAGLTFRDISNAIKYENMTISGGTMDIEGMTRSIRLVGEIHDIEIIKNIILHGATGSTVKLQDIAKVSDSFKDRESYARFNGKNVITLNVIKKSGQNLINASDKIKEIINNLSEKQFPNNLKIQITGDQSKYTKSSLKELNNTIIIGFILVTLILMFFMGLVNAMFVGLSVPLSMALAYIIMPSIGFTMNMLVMFSFIFALGIVVDDAIVVIENTHRIFNKTKMDIVNSAKYAAGEVFLPILSGTITTLAPFFPLAFWPGVVGKFMYYIPVTLIITLFASLIVAYIFNPVFAVDFMKSDEEQKKSMSKKKIAIITGILVLIAAIGYIGGWIGFANLIAFIIIIFILHEIWGYKILYRFQHRYIPAVMRRYDKFIRWAIKGKNPYYLLGGTILLFFITLIAMGIKKPKVVFFPNNEPNSVMIYIKMPVGTSIDATDSIAKIAEQKLYKVLGPSNPYVESVITNIARGASESIFDNTSVNSHKAKITVNFVEFKYRKNISTMKYLEDIREEMKSITGAEIVVDKNRMGPPTGKQINIELVGEDLDKLIESSRNFISYINSLKIPGIENLTSDFDNGKPEIIIDIDRERANREGITTAQIGSEIRTAIYGDEVSKFRDGEDQYNIRLRYDEKYRKNINNLMNHKIVYRDMNSGVLRQIPISALAIIKYHNTYGGIKRLNTKRVITVTSNVITGFTANDIIAQIKKAIPGFNCPQGITIRITGEQEYQKDSMIFLNKALLITLFIILFVLITQFNSMTKPLIILTEVIFSIIGVLWGYIIFNMTISIIMTGIGIIALGGIVVKNGILLVEFTDVLKQKGLRTREAIIQAGKTRITPVLLTASSTILGLIPLAIGFNIDFAGLLTHLKPNIYFGGENVMFFGSLAWTIIFGLTFATFLTLIMIPVMYFIVYAAQIKSKRTRHAINRSINSFDYRKLLAKQDEEDDSV
jgi:multidrug efflux pump subunit AcrB